MIPILYDIKETDFTSNGLCRLRDCIECTVVEERNGIYECDFSYPVDGENYDLIQLGRIIGVTHEDATFERTVQYREVLTDEQNDILTDENGAAFTGTMPMVLHEYDIQPFDIVSYSMPINGVVTFHAVHISYRQSKMVSYATGINSLDDAFTALGSVFFPDNPIGEEGGGNPFTYMTDKDSTGFCAAFDGTPRSIRSLLGGVEGSILDTYGGEYEWDKWLVRLHSERGEQRDFTIRYGVNLADFQDDTDYSESFNCCVPFWKDSSSGATVIGSEINTEQSTIGAGDKCVPLDLSDKFEEQPTVAQLETMATEIMNKSQPYLPKQTIKVDFVRLQDEAGFDEFDSLLQCKLCDSIKVIFPRYNMSAYFKIVKTTWNVLLDRYDEMELGNLSTTLAEALGISESAPSSGSTPEGAVPYYTLLWTNSSPSSEMSPSTLVASGASNYDEIEVIFKTATTQNGYQSVRAPFIAGEHITLLAPAGTTGEFSGNMVNGVRSISMTSAGALYADNAVTMSSSGTSVNNIRCIPYKIYGIKYA